MVGSRILPTDQYSIHKFPFQSHRKDFNFQALLFQQSLQVSISLYVDQMRMTRFQGTLDQCRDLDHLK